MNRVQKQQLLRDMGIDVWRARTQAPVAGLVQAGSEAEPGAGLGVDSRAWSRKLFSGVGLFV